MLLEIWCLDRTRRTKECEGWAACAIGSVDLCVCVCVHVLVRVSVRMGRSGVGTGGQKSKLLYWQCLLAGVGGLSLQFFYETIFHESFHVIPGPGTVPG